MDALALVEGPGHVCCRYLVRAFEPALTAAGWNLTVEGLARGIAARAAQLGRADRFDSVLLQRKLLPSWEFAILRRRARRLVFDFDDAIQHRDSYDRRGPDSRRRARRFARTVQGVDLVIAGNTCLARLAVAAGARPDRVCLIPTCVDPSRYSPTPADRGRSGFDLAWIGSSSTLQGLEKSRAIWERLGVDVPGLRLRIVCDRFPRFDGVQVVEVPWSEATEAAELAGADAGIGWIPDDPWSRGKCGLKLIQYQAAGLPVIANPVGVHAEIVEPGVSGFLAESADEWSRAARALAADPALRERMGRAGRASVESRYAVDVWAPEVVASIAGEMPSKPDGGPRRAKWRRDRGSFFEGTPGAKGATNQAG